MGMFRELHEPMAAYIDPGTGFVLVETLVPLILAGCAFAAGLLFLPFRTLLGLLRRRRSGARSGRVLALGFDGLDPRLLRGLIESGELPRMARLAAEGSFLELETTDPPQSPVAWSSFLTGAGPGRHGVFDFLLPDRKTYLPRLATGEVIRPDRFLSLGSLALPLGGFEARSVRGGRPFWEDLASAGVPATILRMPMAFPVRSGAGTNLLAGLGVPDLMGRQGAYTLYLEGEAVTGETEDETGIKTSRVREVVFEGDRAGTEIEGPDVGGGTSARRPLTLPLALEREGGRLGIRLPGAEGTLGEGEWSPFFELTFRPGRLLRMRGLARFRLESLRPLRLYLTPIQIHPEEPVFPIGRPGGWLARLFRRAGPFSTAGMAEDIEAYKRGALDLKACLEICGLVFEERVSVFRHELRRSREGLLAAVFDLPDRIQHVLWNGPSAEEAPEELRAWYRRIDAIVGEAEDAIGEEGLLLVFSDHGFTEAKRTFHLNRWLEKEGYLSLAEGRRESRPFFRDVAWSRTRAYGVGFNGLFLNLEGREGKGVVRAEERGDLLEEIERKLLDLREEDCGGGEPRRVVLSVRRGADHHGPRSREAPDLVVGYAGGYRIHSSSAIGGVKGSIFGANLSRWRADHCVAKEIVPGTLLSNRRIRGPARIIDLAPTILDRFGLAVPPSMDGAPLEVS